MAHVLDSEYDIEAHFARMAPPSVPAEIFDRIIGLESRVARWDRDYALAMLAGLQVVPEFQANAVRLDTASRLVFGAARGSHHVLRADLYRLINRDLATAYVATQEDPIEDFFVRPVITRFGEFKIIEGLWEKAASFTEDMIEAFVRLPDATAKQQALDYVRALLELSNYVITRNGLGRLVIGTSLPMGTIALPNDRQLKKIAAAATVDWQQLTAINIAVESLAPFGLHSTFYRDVASSPVGDSPLEFQPLLVSRNGLIVVAPSNVSVAARALMVDTALKGGMGSALRCNLLDVQSERVAESASSWPRPTPIAAASGQPVKESIREVSPGRYIHFLHTIDSFSDWPRLGFGGFLPEDEGLQDIVVSAAKSASAMAALRPNFREGISIVLLGGWGRGRSFSIPHVDELRHWEFIFLEPADAATIGVTDGGSPEDLWRLVKQRSRIEDQGFSVDGVNGTINLFALWKATEYTLIPDQEQRIEPPAIFTFPNDLLLEVRKDAVRRSDRSAVLHPDGHHRIVTHLDRDEALDRPGSIYISTHDISQGRLLGVVTSENQPVWLSLSADASDDQALQQYETWEAALRWLAIGLPALRARGPGAVAMPIAIRLHVAWPDQLDGNTVSDRQIDDAIGVSIDTTKRVATISLAPDWQRGLHRMNNYAELALAASFLSAVSAIDGLHHEQRDLLEMMRSTVGSDDIRWRHSFVADRPVSILHAHGLLPPFTSVPRSASALAKCGSVFDSRQRSEGLMITGREACVRFLLDHHDALLAKLCKRITTYNRSSLVTASLAQLQSALAHERIWSLSARALRAMHGIERDRTRSFEVRSRINGVIRGCSILTEIAASQATEMGVLKAGKMDLEELQADALLLFHTAELIPPIQSGFLEAQLRISPTGDVLYDHDFGDKTLKFGAEIHHAQSREESDKSYRRWFEEPGQQPQPPAGLLSAVESEFGMPAAAFLKLSNAFCDLAVEGRRGTLVIRRSALIARLSALEEYAHIDLTVALARLTLPCRFGWSDLPPNLSPADFDIGRFDRPQSLIGRPLVAITNDADPLLVIAPAIVERSAMHNLAGASQGGLQGKFWSSPEMVRFSGRVANELGLKFNDRVADAIRGLGLTAEPSVKPSACLNHKATPELKLLGDIDVLAITMDGSHVWVVEAKDIRLCRTLGETASRLSEYRGAMKINGKPDKLLRHLDRVAYVRKYAADLAKRLKLPVVPMVHGLLVVDSPQPMAFMPVHVSPDASVVMLDNLAAVPWHAGRPSERVSNNTERRKAATSTKRRSQP